MTIKLNGQVIKRLPVITKGEHELPNLSSGLAYVEDAERVIETLQKTIQDIRDQVQRQLMRQLESFQSGETN